MSSVCQGVTAATSECVKSGRDDRECDTDHRRSGVGHAIGRPNVEGDGADRQQCEADRRGDTDGRPHQSHEYPRHAGEFACTDEPPLKGFDAEMVADGKGPGDPEQFDARREREEHREQRGHYHGGGVHHQQGRSSRASGRRNGRCVQWERAVMILTAQTTPNPLTVM